MIALVTKEPATTKPLAASIMMRGYVDSHLKKINNV
jgi:hypothetical protein